MPAAELLTRFGLFAGLPAPTQNLVLERAQLKTFDAAMSIQRRGAEPKHLVAILSGSLAIGVQSVDGERFVRWYIPPGEVHGILSVLDGQPLIYDTIAHERSEVLLISRGSFLAAMNQDIELMRRVLEVLVRRSRMLHETSAAESLLTLDGRVARMLLMLADAYGREHLGGTLITLHVSQDDMASLLGVTRQSVGRSLKNLVNLGAISLRYAQITILNSDLLDNLITEKVDRKLSVRRES